MQQWQHVIPMASNPNFQIFTISLSLRLYPKRRINEHWLISLDPHFLEGSQLMPQKHFTGSSTKMKVWSLLAALAFTLLLVVSSTEVNYSLTFRVKSSSHQALKDLRGHRKDPSKQVVESCFRAIPPSKSNPTQNK